MNTYQMMFRNASYQNLLYQNIFFNNYYNNQNFFYLGNVPYQSYCFPNYQKIYSNRRNNYHNFQKKNKSSENIIKNIKYPIKKEEKVVKKVKEANEEKQDNCFEKINNIKITHRRRSSIDTTICDSSFNSNLSEDYKEEEKEEEMRDKKIAVNKLKKKLSNISEANSETSQCNDITDNNSNNNDDDLNGSFFSETDTDNNDKSDEKKSYNDITNSFNVNKNKAKNENKCEEYKGNPDFENTEILRVNVKISKDKNAIFRLKRYDDVFETIKIFCEINLIDEKLIKPLIIKSLSAMNTIYQIMNCKLDDENIKLLKSIKRM